MFKVTRSGTKLAKWVVAFGAAIILVSGQANAAGQCILIAGTFTIIAAAGLSVYFSFVPPVEEYDEI